MVTNTAYKVRPLGAVRERWAGGEGPQTPVGTRSVPIFRTGWASGPSELEVSSEGGEVQPCGLWYLLPLMSCVVKF